jgi:hypothetical protein
VDTDPQTDPDPADEPSDDGQTADAAPVEDEATGAAPTEDLPAAQDTDWAANEAIGDFTTPDVDLSGLTPADDGDPDDEDPAETVDQDATGQATVAGDWETRDDAQGDSDVQEPTA